MKHSDKLKSALEPDEIYIGDIGRTFCGELRCAGSSCHFSGRDLSGHRVYKIGMSDIVANEGDPFLQGFRYKCEGCGKEAPAHLKRDRQITRKVSQR